MSLRIAHSVAHSAYTPRHATYGDRVPQTVVENNLLHLASYPDLFRIQATNTELRYLATQEIQRRQRLFITRNSREELRRLLQDRQNVINNPDALRRFDDHNGHYTTWIISHTITDMSEMFVFENRQDCTWNDLHELEWVMEHCTNTHRMFANCTALRTIPIHFKPKNATNMSYMFQGCT